MLSELNMSYNICDVDSWDNKDGFLPSTINQLNRFLATWDNQGKISRITMEEKIRKFFINKLNLSEETKLEDIYYNVPESHIKDAILSVHKIRALIESSYRGISVGWHDTDINVDIKMVKRTMKMMGVDNYSIENELQFIKQKLVENSIKDLETGLYDSKLRTFLDKSREIKQQIIYDIGQDINFVPKWRNRYVITYYINGKLYGQILVMKVIDKDIDPHGNKFIVMRYISKTPASYIVENVYGIKLPKLNDVLIPIVEQLADQLDATRIYVDPYKVQRNILTKYYGFNSLPPEYQNEISNYVYNFNNAGDILYKDIEQD